jgi:peptidoglycan pentaglycine glycine transferase (the first glycine)
MDATTWNNSIKNLPAVHLLQTWEWGKVKQAYGWLPKYKLWKSFDGSVNAAALVLKRSISARLFPNFSVMYVPRGPLMDWSNESLRKRVVHDLIAMAYQNGAIFIKIDPEIQVGAGVPGEPGSAENQAAQSLLSEFQADGWRFSDSQVQFKNTVWLDVSGTEENLLGRMKQKTRYNLRLAERKGIVVRTGTPADFPMMYRMYAETSVRDGFVIRPEEYYSLVWKTFLDHQMLYPLIAEFEGQPIAGIMMFAFAGKAWYLYGMSTGQHRDKMPNYLLQWEAMRTARQAGCNLYDLWGAPDEFNETDPMWGVFRFKEGLGGQVIRTAGAWDYPVRPNLYTLYTRTLPRILAVMRRRRVAATRTEVSV